MIMTQTKGWASGLCNCCGHNGQSYNQCKFFCGAMCCPCIAQAYLQKHAGLADDCCGPACFYFCLGGYTSNIVPCISLFNLRNTVATAAGIKEGCLCSLCKVLFCFACAMSQVNNELILSNRKFNVKASDCNCLYLLGCVSPPVLISAGAVAVKSIAVQSPVVHNSMVIII